MALALVLLVGAGLMLRTSWGLQQVDPGFRVERLLSFRIQLPETRYPEPFQVAGFYDALLERLESLPDIESTGSVNLMPTIGTYYGGFSIVGMPPRDPDEVTSALSRTVSPGYFRTMEIPVLRGRAFTPFDTESAPPVLLVNDAFVSRYVPDLDVIGQQVDIGAPFDAPLEVVGVVGNVTHLGLDSEPRPAMYTSSLQNPSFRSLAVAVRTVQEPMTLAADVRSVVAALDSDVPVYNLMTGADMVGSSVTQGRFAMILLELFAALAVVRAVVGIYGVISYSTSLRSHEIGVRIALGARASDVLVVFLGLGMKLALVGLSIGLGGAFALTRVLQGLLFGVTATDPMTFASAILLLLSAAIVASVVSARRASRISPVNALHHE